MGIHYDSQTEVVWIGQSDLLPDTCCDCGSFTDNRVVVKHIDLVSHAGKSSLGTTLTVLTFFVHLALGPVGWLISALMHGDEDKKETRWVKQKSKIKISQCRLCSGVQSPEIIESQNRLYAFLVHPKFKHGFEDLREE